MKDSIKNKGVLISSAFGVAALGLTIGLLRGYPNGEAVTPSTRAIASPTCC